MRIIEFKRPISDRQKMERAIEAELIHLSGVVRDAEMRMRALHQTQDYLAEQDESERKRR